jgi:hypothetical protein
VESEQELTEEEFISGVRPMVDVIVRLVETARAVDGEQLPDASSRAMYELSQEGVFATPQSENPVELSHNMARLLRGVVDDHLESFARLFDSPPVPFVSHLPSTSGNPSQFHKLLAHRARD